MIGRREILTTCGVTLSALAGCSGVMFERAERRADDEIADAPMEPPDEATDDYEIRSLRVPGEETVVSVGDDDRQYGRQIDFVLDGSDADAIQFDVGSDESEPIRSFLEATDFDAESVVIHQRPIEECYERRIEYVIAEPDRYRVQFCRRLRDATVSCSADATEMEAVFVRVPHAYADRPSRTSRGQRGQCRRGHRSGTETAAEVG